MINQVYKKIKIELIFFCFFVNICKHLVDVVRKNIFETIKYELRHKNRFSTDHLIDVIAAKRVFKTLEVFSKDEYKSLPDDYIHGFIQEISLDPFGFLLFSNLQVVLFVKP